MRFMVFCDLENFRYSLKNCFQNHIDINFERFHLCLFNKIVQLLNIKVHNPQFVRAYLYTGEYTDAQIDQAKKHLNELPFQQKKAEAKIKDLETKLITAANTEKERIKRELQHERSNYFSPERVENLAMELEKAKLRQKAQAELFHSLGYVSFLELRTKPLKYSRKDLRFIQKGTDVQLAVDLVNFAHFNNYDCAIVCSGDLDLLESCRQIKSLGKTVILVSHKAQVSPIMIRESDYYLNLGNLTSDELKDMVVTN